MFEGSKAGMSVFYGHCPQAKSYQADPERDFKAIKTALCQVDRALYLTVQPVLYEYLDIRVPLRWQRLASLESLLSTNNSGFRFTRAFRIINSRTLDGAGADKGGLGVLKVTEQDVEARFLSYEPESHASYTLNGLIRLILGRLTPNSLRIFLWHHDCFIDTVTIYQLFTSQGKSLQHLAFRAHISGQGEAQLSYAGLRRLYMPDLRLDEGTWPLQLLAQNYGTLEHLHIGIEGFLFREYAKKGRLEANGDERWQKTTAIVSALKSAKDKTDQATSDMRQLKSMTLIGLDISALCAGTEAILKFNCLQRLCVESCVGLETAFSFLVAKATDSDRIPFQELRIRHEHISATFLNILRDFLVKLRPLKRLHILLEGECTRAGDLKSILKVHGRSLMSLVWEQRTGPRLVWGRDTIVSRKDHMEFRLIAKYCRELRSLGLGVRWDHFHDFMGANAELESFFSKLKYLRTFNIRGLPAMSLDERGIWLDEDYFFEGLATKFAERICQALKTISNVETLCLGPITFGGMKLSTAAYDREWNYMQPRIYHLQYLRREGRLRTVSPWVAKAQLLAVGNVHDAEDWAKDLGIFSPCWLDGKHYS
ncbi:uncharacterized protein KY384_005824 [Bacidia gigantensis]|uniref:uncharacterized protein n=1 Tax=Bacidia gigantensis TaxID=2732470 RepID=UPI001D05199D|nr:uncharacterized protein KY384_005824 [Bacidia gigantensis]KAG8529189.1 hypothetical protein KY384_005824 [Bacidia gigantensis]